MKHEGLEDLRTVTFFSMFALALLTFAVVLSGGDMVRSSPAASPEVGVKEYSPLGSAGGAVIPASCPSYAHETGQCTPPTVSCTPSTVLGGDPVECTWDCPSTYTSAGIGFSTGGGNSGSVEFTPEETGEYGVLCSSGQQQTVTVTVLNPALSISANPTRVRSGNSSAITWSATSVDTCTVTGPGFSEEGTSGGPQSTGAITAQSTYTLACETDAGSVSASVTVTLIPSIIETGE